jgi:hypothetical protein
MKTNQKFLTHLLAVLAVTALFGCANNNSGNNSVQVRSSGAAPTTLSAVVGQLTYNSSYANTNGTLTSAVQSLLNESVPAGTSIGVASSVSLAGQVHFSGAAPTQALISSQSYVQLQIQTSAQTAPFLISVGMNDSGKGSVVYQTSNATANMLFQDQFGWIQVYGNFTSGSPSMFSGEIYYGPGLYNGNSATGSYLGNFSIQTCSFFTCQ